MQPLFSSYIATLVLAVVGSIAATAAPARTSTEQNAASSALPERPRLVVGIVVEGLTMDGIELLRPLFSADGINRLLNNGVTITDLDFGTQLDGAAATTMLFTGASPRLNGIPAAEIYDRELRKAQSPLLDPETIGNFTDETLSPKAICTTTLGDELRIDGGGLAYVYSIALDPIQAMAMAGHAGNSAAWINDQTGRWATSTFYKDLPTPLQSRNHNSPLVNRLDTMQWQPSVAPASLPDLPSFKKLYPFRHSFPHNMPRRIQAYKNSPLANSDVTALGEEYLTQLTLGQRETTDMLTLGLSVQPFLYGREPDVRAETMDSYLRLDRDLQHLLSTIDQKGPGMQNTLVFLAGTPISSRTRRDDEKWNIPYGEFSPKKAISLLNMYLMALHGNGEWVNGYHNGQFFLNHTLIKDRNKNLEQMRSEAAEFMLRMSGVKEARTITEINDLQSGDNPEAVRRNTPLASAGDIFISIAPGWQEASESEVSGNPVTVERSASTFAPAFILAPQLQQQTIGNAIDARALAPTVAAILRIRSPNGASVAPLRF